MFLNIVQIDSKKTPKRRKSVEEKQFKPFIPAEKVVPEFTLFSVVLGAILAVVFGGANAYLGLRVGMTVSASIFGILF